MYHNNFIYCQMQEDKNHHKIQSRVNNYPDISHRVMNYISEQAGYGSSPFQLPQNILVKQSKAKRSLTDWRQLYIKNNNKIVPKTAEKPTSSQDSRHTYSSFGKYRRTHYLSSKKKMQSSNEQSTYDNIKRKSSTKQNILHSAIAQNIKQRQQSLQIRAQTAKDKQFYETKCIQFKRRSNQCLPIQKLLYKMQNKQKQDPDLTKYFINKAINMNNKILPYNMARIKQKSKINNSKFFDSKQNPFIFKKQIENMLGLRYYQRN